jgi:hypothetical protein
LMIKNIPNKYAVSMLCFVVWSLFAC